MAEVHNPNRSAALALLNANDPPLTRKAGQFLGQIAVEHVTLTPAQQEWFGKLCERGGVGDYDSGGAK